MPRRIFPVMALGALACLSPATNEFFHFNPGFSSAVFKVSSNGQTAVGVTDGAVFRWTPQGGAVAISGSDWMHTFTAGVSDDGDTIVSTMLNPNTQFEEAAVWRPGQGWSFIGGVSIGVDNHLSSGYDVSGDGSRLVGLAWHTNYRAEAFLYSASLGMAGLGRPASASSRATSISRDGGTVVGFYENDATSERRSVRWTNGGGPDLFMGESSIGEALGVDSTGTQIVGYDFDFSTNMSLAYVYAHGVATSLGILPEHATNMMPRSLANAVSDNGTVVGYSGGDSSWGDAEEGFVWTKPGGMVSISDFLAGMGVAVPNNLHLNTVTSISADGTTLAGQAVNLDTGFYEAWVARLGVGSTEILAPTEEQVLLGTTNSGGNLASWAADDADARSVCKFFVPNATSPFVRIRLAYQTTKPIPTAMSLGVKVASHTPGLQFLSVSVLDTTTGAYSPTTVTNANIVDGSVYAGVVTGDLADFVNNGSVSVRVEVKQAGPSTQMFPCVSFEFGQLTVTD